MDDGALAGLHPDELLRFARVLTGDRQLAEDLVQDVLVALPRRPGRSAEIDDLDRYARRMVVNGFVSWRRMWQRIVPRRSFAPKCDETALFARSKRMPLPAAKKARTICLHM